jgi:hypothetical protein
MKRVHASSYSQYLESIQSPPAKAGQTQMTDFTTSTESKHYGSSNPRQRSLTKLLVTNLLVKCGLPISIVDNDDFRTFLGEMDPKYRPPCRQTVTSTILPQMLEQHESRLKAVLATYKDLSLTVDIWTDRRSHSYLGVTVHAFSSGLPQSHLLAFKTFGGSHTGDNIAEALDTIITENGIGSKIRSIVTDNASNMRRALTVLLDVDDTSTVTAIDVDDPSLWDDDISIDTSSIIMDCQHLACFAHSLQLVVRDGLATLTVARSMTAKCCKLANLVHQSALFRHAYERAMGVGKIVPSSNETRWNSTYRQLQCVADLDQAKLNALLRETGHENLIMTQKDCCILFDVVKVLEPFADATDLTQGELVVTISCVVPIVMVLNNKLNTFQQSMPVLSSFITTLLNSLHDRFAGLYSLLGMEFIPSTKTPKSTKSSNNFGNELFLMAAAIDPTYSFQWLQDHPGSPEAKEGLRNKITGKMSFCMHYKLKFLVHTF